MNSTSCPCHTGRAWNTVHCEDVTRDYTWLLRRFYVIITYHLPSTFSKAAIQWMLLAGFLDVGISCRIVTQILRHNLTLAKSG